MSGKILVVRPKTIDDVLVNPGIGFTTFQRFNGDVLNEGKCGVQIGFEKIHLSGNHTSRRVGRVYLLAGA